ncbi:MAG: chemotaxis protein CheW [Polyangiaceae bacterium]
MSEVSSDLSRRLADLRSGFDAAFARPSAEAAKDSVGLLLLRLGTERYALRVTELSDVVAACKVVPLPGSRPELLGIAGVRGRFVPVYSLASLVGGPSSPSWSWIAICGSEEALGLTFDTLEAYVQVAPADLVAATSGDGSGGHVREVLRKDGTLAAVISTASIVGSIKSRAQGPREGH